MAVNTYGDINQRTAAWVVSEFLKTVAPVLVLAMFALTKPVPKNKAEAVKFRRRVPFAVDAVPLTEGVTPTGLALTFEDVSLTLQQYGSVVNITDKVADLAEDPILAEATQGLAEHAAGTMEKILWNTIKAGTVVYYANGTARTSVNTPVTVGKLRSVVQNLKIQKAEKITRVLDGSPNYGTRPVEASYVAVCHTYTENDIRELPGFVPVSKYGTQKPLCAYEFGSLDEIRFVTSPELTPFTDGGGTKAGSGTTMISTSGTSADVFPIIILGREAFATVPLKGGDSVKPMVLQPGVPRGGDALGQNGSVGYKAYMNAVILNQTFMARLEVAATQL